MILGWSILESFLLLITIGIAMAGTLALFAPGLSATINDLVKYGKSVNKHSSPLVKCLSVPKRWFSHFYIVAVTCTSLWLALALLADYRVVAPEVRMRSWLRWLTLPRNNVSVDATTALLTLGLLWLHTVRRLFESLFVSVYSDTEMNLLHYLVGLAHYFLLPLAIVAETSGFLNATEFSTNLASVGRVQFLGVLLFLICSYSQHQCLTKFASMRRNHLGNITNYAHGIPFGGLFDYVSCPHFLYEIGIYVSLFLCLNTAHHLWVYVLVFVVSNQTIAALITHKWYHDRFKAQYPADRKALIPFVL